MAAALLLASFLGLRASAANWSGQTITSTTPIDGNVTIDSNTKATINLGDSNTLAVTGAITIEDGGTLEVQSGTLEVTNQYGNSISANDNATITVSGGQLHATSGDGNGIYLECNGSTIKVSGGQLNAKSTNGNGIYLEGNGNTIKVSSTGHLEATGSSGGGSGIYFVSDATITVSGGELTATGDGTGRGIHFGDSGGEVTFTGPGKVTVTNGVVIPLDLGIEAPATFTRFKEWSIEGTDAYFTGDTGGPGAVTERKGKVTIPGDTTVVIQPVEWPPPSSPQPDPTPDSGPDPLPAGPVSGLYYGDSSTPWKPASFNGSPLALTWSGFGQLRLPVRGEIAGLILEGQEPPPRLNPGGGVLFFRRRLVHQRGFSRGAGSGQLRGQGCAGGRRLGLPSPGDRVGIFGGWGSPFVGAGGDIISSSGNRKCVNIVMPSLFWYTEWDGCFNTISCPVAER